MSTGSWEEEMVRNSKSGVEAMELKREFCRGAASMRGRSVRKMCVRGGTIGIVCLMLGLLAVAASARGPVFSEGRGQEAASAPAAAMPEDPPETVLVTYRPIAGKEDATQDLIQRHWETIKRLGLVTGDPHQLYRASDAARHAYFVDILTWKSHEAPDTAPTEVRAIWKEMRAAVEDKPGLPGIDIVEIHSVHAAK